MGTIFLVCDLREVRGSPADPRVLYCVRACEVCGGPSGTVIGFSPVLRFSPVTTIPPMPHIHLLLHVARTRKTNGCGLRTFQKISALLEIGELWIKSTSTFFLDQAVGRRPRTAEARVRLQAGPCEIYGGQRAPGQVFLSVLLLSPVSIIPPALHILLLINATCIRRTSGRTLGTFQQSSALSDIGKHLGRKILLHCINLRSLGGILRSRR